MVYLFILALSPFANTSPWPSRVRGLWSPTVLKLPKSSSNQIKKEAISGDGWNEESIVTNDTSCAETAGSCLNIDSVRGNHSFLEGEKLQGNTLGEESDKNVAIGTEEERRTRVRARGGRWNVKSRWTAEQSFPDEDYVRRVTQAWWCHLLSVCDSIILIHAS